METFLGTLAIGTPGQASLTHVVVRFDAIRASEFRVGRFGAGAFVDCDESRSPARRHLHGRERVDGSSPSEGSLKAPQHGAFTLPPGCTLSSVLSYGTGLEQPDENGLDFVV
jgi:hypothetical protein